MWGACHFQIPWYDTDTTPVLLLNPIDFVTWNIDHWTARIVTYRNYRWRVRIESCSVETAFGSLERIYRQAI